MWHMDVSVTTASVPCQLPHSVPCMEIGLGHLPLARRDILVKEKVDEADAVVPLFVWTSGIRDVQLEIDDFKGSCLSIRGDRFDMFLFLLSEKLNIFLLPGFFYMLLRN